MHDRHRIMDNTRGYELRNCGSIPYGGTKQGSVAEWSKAAVLKTDGCNRSVGSNPTASAIDSMLRKYHP